MFEGLKTRCSRHTPGTCTTCNGSWPVSCSPSPSLSGTYPAIKNCGCERLYSPQTGGASEERLSSLSSPQHVGHRFVRHLMPMLPCHPALQLMLMLPCRPGVHGMGPPPSQAGGCDRNIATWCLVGGPVWAQPAFQALVQVFPLLPPPLPSLAASLWRS